VCKSKRIAPAALRAALALAAATVSAEFPASGSAESQSGTTAAPSTERLAHLVQGTPLGHPEPTPVAGIFRVKIGSDYVYLTANGQYAFAGSLVDLSTGENLTEARRNGDRLEALSGFPADDFLLFPAEGEERARVLVFTDTTCPYCRKLHQEVPALRKAGVTIAYIPFPRGGKGSLGEQALRSVWCAEDRTAAFNIAVGQADGKPGTADCPAAAAVDAGYRLGLQVGVSGTPTIVLPTGAALPGYLNVQGLLAHLGLGKVPIAR